MFQRWSMRNGYRDVLTVSLPLVVSLGSTTLMQFTDRLFLGRYSLDAIAAAVPGGIGSFLFQAFFLGVAGYVNVFVAQYTGANRPERVGASIWQGVRFSLLAGLVMWGVALAAGPIFALAGHPAPVRALEEEYFRILCLGSPFLFLETTLSAFYTGRGLTRVVMCVNILGAALNIPLDYLLIYGGGPIPSLGIAGAALATAFAWAVIALCYVFLVFKRENETLYRMRSAWRFDRELFGRLMRFGLPGGVQFFIDMFAITFFVFMVGRLGTVALAATNIVFALNTLAFLPMIGFSIGVSTLVGQAVGRGAPDEGDAAATSTLHLAMAYMCSMAALFVLAPRMLIAPFAGHAADPEAFAAIASTAVVLLRFVAAYSVFDAAAIVYFGALKGAGDIAFVMKAMLFLSLAVMVGPVGVMVWRLDTGLYGPWACLTLYVILLAAVFGLRFRRGAWRAMSVLEPGG